MNIADSDEQKRDQVENDRTAPTPQPSPVGSIAGAGYTHARQAQTEPKPSTIEDEQHDEQPEQSSIGTPTSGLPGVDDTTKPVDIRPSVGASKPTQAKGQQQA